MHSYVQESSRTQSSLIVGVEMDRSKSEPQHALRVNALKENAKQKHRKLQDKDTGLESKQDERIRDGLITRLFVKRKSES